MGAEGPQNLGQSAYAFRGTLPERGHLDRATRDPFSWLFLEGASMSF